MHLFGWSAVSFFKNSVLDLGTMLSRHNRSVTEPRHYTKDDRETNQGTCFYDTGILSYH